jgi:hypothetical protein
MIDDDALLPEVVFLSPIPEFGLKVQCLPAPLVS